MAQKKSVRSLGRTIKFGPYKVKLTRDCQLNYYKDDIQMRAKDVSHDYDEESLYKHVLELAIKQGYSEKDLQKAD